MNRERKLFPKYSDNCVVGGCIVQKKTESLRRVVDKHFLNHPVPAALFPFIERLKKTAECHEQVREDFEQRRSNNIRD